ncbi:rod shape-determining protein MreC [uncultured Clostridium sp.]|uniref:Cell shape-determining protein MreC n=1 Tax=Paeniclostridium hominis TaxID=2764329 RepID=A0ABR7JZE0_9FIRM|nr:rod shape-determining protein MreC [Paeniclostridium hominis]MBC8631270.1 rod shape-determining protein MreC [[Eubacterium] tenue]MDU2591026.1 rod shape-determining protein MreC [Paeniclostridium sordellii]SCJ19578.1 rod shape-determining protein MreC [uncultured Clostridium sp.]SCJ19694.1 rod shape-determining protein MreC [uncultured Clostridium sp.]
MKLGKNKKNNKKYNVKVIATIGVAITLIGIVGMSIGRYSKDSFAKNGFILNTISSIEGSLNNGFTFIKEGTGNIFKFKENAKKVKQLEKENENLKKEIIELKEDAQSAQSLQSLKKSLKFIEEDYKDTMISTEVVSKNDGNWYTSFVIGAGKDEGVKKNSIVMNGKGLVGIVTEVSNHYSKAISLLDTKSSVSFQLLKNKEFKGVISQGANEDENYKAKGLLEGYMFKTSYDVLPGDVLVTSGLGIYPKSIPIGEIEKVVDDKNKGLKYVVVKPYVNFKDVDDVVVIEPRNIN